MNPPTNGERIRFESKVYPEPNSGCWLWEGNISTGGYGRFGINYTRPYAHRFSYESYVGPIPDGLLVCHKCDVPACVNPAHLFLGTDLDNTRDMLAKGRARPRRKLSDDEVARIRADYTSGVHSQTALARSYGVTQSWISVLVCMRKRVA